MKLNRLISALLLFAMLLSCLQFTAMAVDGENYFYFSAETSETLVVSPQKIPYSADQTITEALTNAGIALTFDDNRFVTAIQGTFGNYLYFGDFSSSTSMLVPANSVHFLFFTEDREASLAAGRMALMQSMADYLEEAADVKNAAADAYQAALAAYPCISDGDAATHATRLKSAIEDYKTALSTTFDVTVTVSEANCSVTAINEYGLEFSTDGDRLSLPRGIYTIQARAENRIASCEKVAVPGTDNVTLTLPTGNWFDEAGFQLSRTYESMDAEDGNRFRDGLCVTEQNEAHTVVAQIPDAFAGELYPYVAKANGVPALALTVSYRKADGSMVTEQAFPAASKTTSLSDAVRLGTAGNEIVFRLRPVEGEDTQSSGACVQSMELKLVLARVPTLQSLRMENADGTVQAADLPFSPLTQEYTYKIVETDEVKFQLEATTAGSEISVSAGTLQYSPDTDGNVSVPIEGDTRVLITVSSGGYMTVYTVNVLPSAGKSARFTLVDADTLEVRNKNGEVLGFTSERDLGGTMVYIYTLVPDEEYSYVATKNTYYHTKKTFLADADSDTESTYLVKVTAGDWLEALAFGAGERSDNKGGLAISPTFAAETHRYTATISDATNAVYVWATATQNGIAAIYPVQSASRGELPAAEAALTSGKLTGTRLPEVLLSGSGHGNTITFRVARHDSGNGVTDYVDYEVELQRKLNLRGMRVSWAGEAVPLYRSDGTTTGYARAETDYSVRVPAAAGSLDLVLQAPSGPVKYGDGGRGYVICVNDRLVPENGQISVPLHGGSGEERIRIVLTNEYAPGAQTVYTIQVRKAETKQVRFEVTPSDALIYLYEPTSGNRVWPDGNAFALSEGFTYQCAITKAGYVGQSGALTLEDGVLTFCGTAQPDPDRVTITLEAAKPDGLTHDLEAKWPDFRGNSGNNAVTDAPAPIQAEEGTLYWAAQFGSGHSSNAVSNPILVNGELIVYAGNQIYRVDKDTGETIQSGTMAGTSDFAINGPTYADGMLLVGLSNGRVQAFDAVTLDSLWIYTDPLRGQANCPITVADGYAYTGFWNSETRDASFVCLSLTDENPERTDEAKCASWRHVQTGGFYWAGACVQNGLLLVGTDDGEAGYDHTSGQILLLDAKTGEKLDGRSGIRGDVRSSICYDSATDAYYATSKGGDFIQLTLGQTDGSWKITACRALPLENRTGGTPMSTSTPVVYQGRAYIGVSGSSQFGTYSGHNITVIDLKAWSIAYTVPTKGYPQTSGLLTTAYEAETGYVYVYFFENDTPGTMRVLRDSANQREADAGYVTLEAGISAAYALFSPVGAQAQFCICSPIADENGTLYFKNDSAHLMAFGSALKGMTVSVKPKKTEYKAGEMFAPEGLAVTGVFANGVKRDVTKALSFPETAIQEDDAAVSAAFGGALKMYHNESDGAGGMQSGITTRYAALEIPITVKSDAVPGEIGGLTWRYWPQRNTLRVTGDFGGRTLIAACYDAGGRMIQARMLTEAGTISLAQNGAAIRLFLLKDGTPVCPAVPVEAPTA